MTPAHHPLSATVANAWPTPKCKSTNNVLFGTLHSTMILNLLLYQSVVVADAASDGFVIRILSLHIYWKRKNFLKYSSVCYFTTRLNTGKRWQQQQVFDTQNIETSKNINHITTMFSFTFPVLRYSRAVETTPCNVDVNACVTTNCQLSKWW